MDTQSVPDPEHPAAGPLAGLRVLDCSSLIAGPTAAMYLGDYGAEVVKIEHPQGDGLRVWGAVKDGAGLYFKMLNRNKRAITADLHTAARRRDRPPAGRARRRDDRELPARARSRSGAWATTRWPP